MSQPVVSVIIPTNERAKYAVPTVRSMLDLEGEIEVVVCDTSREDQISAELRDHPNISRLKLVRPGKTLSVVDNFNTLVSREEIANSEDMGAFLRIPADHRDLNYSTASIDHDLKTNMSDDYTSDNTTRLSVPNIKELLLTLDGVRSEL